MTPMMYHITPFVCFCSGPDAVTKDAAASKEETYLFAFTHEESDGAFEEPLETRGAEAEDIARDDEREPTRERDDDLLGRAVRVIQVQCQESCTHPLNNLHISTPYAGLTDRRVQNLPRNFPLVNDFL